MFVLFVDTTGSENFTRSEINRELLMTSAAMEDNYDIVNMSRSKDKDVLSRANRAIVSHCFVLCCWQILFYRQSITLQ